MHVLGPRLTWCSINKRVSALWVPFQLVSVSWGLCRYRLHLQYAGIRLAAYACMCQGLYSPGATPTSLRQPCVSRFSLCLPVESSIALVCSCTVQETVWQLIHACTRTFLYAPHAAYASLGQPCESRSSVPLALQSSSTLSPSALSSSNCVPFTEGDRGSVLFNSHQLSSTLISCCQSSSTLFPSTVSYSTLSPSTLSSSTLSPSTLSPLALFSSVLFNSSLLQLCPLQLTPAVCKAAVAACRAAVAACTCMSRAYTDLVQHTPACARLVGPAPACISSSLLSPLQLLSAPAEGSRMASSNRSPHPQFSIALHKAPA